MSGSVPSFIKPSEKYEDLFPEDELMMLETPIAATPVSRFPASMSVKTELSAAEKRRLSQVAGGSKSTPETRSSKKAKVSQQGTPAGDVEQFFQMSGGQIPMEIITGWARQRSSDAAKSMLFSSGESFFHQLRLSNQLALATRGDMRLRDEIKQLKLDRQAMEEEKKKLLDAGKKLKVDLSELTREKDRLAKLVASQNTEKEERTVAHATTVKELTLQVDMLQASVKKLKEALPERYNTGFSKGVNDYLKATWEVMPDLDWSLLGEDAVNQVEKFKAEATKAGATGRHIATTPPVTQKGTAEFIPTPETMVEAPALTVEVAPWNSSKKNDPVEDSPSSDAVKDAPSA